MQDLSPKELSALLFEPQETVRLAALREIVARHEVSLIGSLHEALQSAAPSAFFCLLVEALAALGQSASVDVLKEQYQRSLPEFARLSLIQSLSRFSESESFLQKIVSDGSAALRLMALRGLVTLGGENLAALVSEAFLSIPANEEIVTFFEKVPEASQALVLRLVLGESLSVEKMRIATKIFAQRHEMTALPILGVWSEQEPSLRALCQRVIRKLQRG